MTCPGLSTNAAVFISCEAATSDHSKIAASRFGFFIVRVFGDKLGEILPGSHFSERPRLRAAPLAASERTF